MAADDEIINFPENDDNGKTFNNGRGKGKTKKETVTPPVAETPAKDPVVNSNEQTSSGDDEAFITSNESTVIAAEQEQTTSGNPLDTQVVERAYTSAPFNGDTTTPIAEPIIKQEVQAPVSNVDTPDKTELRADQVQQHNQSKQYATNSLGEKEAGSAPGNPAVSNMSAKEKKDNLDMTVDTFIHYYVEAKLFIGDFFTFSEGKMMALEAKNEIRSDWAVMVDTSTNEVLTLRQFLKECNTQMIECCKTSEEFKAKLRPILKAEFERRGWIVSPQQNAMLMIGEDLFMMCKNLFSINRNIAVVLKRVADESADQRNGTISARSQYNNNLGYKIPATQIIEEKIPETIPPVSTTTPVKTENITTQEPKAEQVDIVPPAGI